MRRRLASAGLEPARLVDRTGLAEIAGIGLEDLPHPERGRRRLPPPQAEASDGPRWLEPVARDWAECRPSADGPAALLAASTSFGTSHPRGLVADHNLLTGIIKDSLDDEDAKSSKRRFARTGEKSIDEAAATLAWWPAVALTEGPGSLFPVSAMRTI
ncbi:hypothetical protein [Streptomyces sp. NPDC059828]|uniref:hypothetical protein n=1 Tax=Streptomyces sp. NPDC059828 TaxID=3346965 RepID=UPI003659D197